MITLQDGWKHFEHRDIEFPVLLWMDFQNVMLINDRDYLDKWLTYKANTIPLTVKADILYWKPFINPVKSV